MSPEDIRSLGFFWSVRRRRYWQQCRRRYFLHYYLARIGRGEEADATCREVLALDRQVTAQAFIRIIITRCMHDMFQRGEQGELAQAAVLHLRHEINRMLTYPETVPLLVGELFEGNIPVKETLAYLREEVRRAGEKVDANFWQKIQYIPMEMRRYVTLPQRVNLMELACYFVPAVVFSIHGELWVLESSGVKEAGNLISCLHRLYALNDLGHDPVRVRSLYLDDCYELQQLDDLTSVSASLEEIKSDVASMTEAEMEGFVTLHDFPPSPGPFCHSCQFRQFCASRGTFLEKS